MLNKINKSPEINKVYKYWYHDNAFKTGFIHSLSVVFPGGERFFMKSLNHYSKDCPEFKNEIRMFSIQESNHTKCHTQLNKKIDNLYNNCVLQDLELATHELLNLVHKKLSPELNLIITEALEHITFNLCESLLERQDVLDQMYSEAKDVIIYHCLEETGYTHSSIAKRIADKVIIRGCYKLARRLAIRPVTLVLLLVLFSHLIYIQKQNKNIRLRETLTGLNDLFGFEGWVRDGLQKAITTW
jgi:predicted metal-dependent hydrolase